MVNIPILIIEILWIFIWCTLCMDYFDVLASVPTTNRIIGMIIFFIGAPFFLIVNVLEFMLNLIFPDGWNDDDDDPGGL